ncbi:MAG: hypothetical protein ACI4QR_03520, partial [Eubacteriales bacterium]
GFVSLFDDIFSEKSLSHLYIIKGGPGTGKSTFMRGITDTARSRGYDAEYYYCSADTNSLDGIKIPSLGVAVIDGTSPHTVDPKYPGAAATIVNLGDNFDVASLSENRAKIEALTDLCSSYYASARRYLHAAGEMERARLDIAMKAFDIQKARRAAERLIRGEPCGSGKLSERYISALGVRGRVSLPTAKLMARKVIYISGKYGMDLLFMSVLFDTAAEKGYDIMRFPTVLIKERTEALYFESSGTLFALCDDTEGERINAMRFALQEKLSFCRAKLRFAERCALSLTDGALESLAEMGRTHDELEKYYIASMDFDKNNIVRKELENDIFG